MRELIRKAFGENRKETIRYLLMGVVTSAVNLSVFFLMTEWLGINYLLSNITAWVMTVLVGFVGNKKYVFKTPYGSRRAVLSEFLKFGYGRVFSFFVDTALLWLLVSVCGFDSAIIKLVNSVVVVLLNYVISKRWVFKKFHK